MHIEEDDRRRVVVKKLHRFTAIARLRHDRQLGPGLGQMRCQMLAQQGFVVGDQSGRRGGVGGGGGGAGGGVHAGPGLRLGLMARRQWAR